ncbi:MAG: efflux RND transporter periplasmic adaptor subunit [Candidatus Acidiferrum sp.]
MCRPKMAAACAVFGALLLGGCSSAEKEQETVVAVQVTLAKRGPISQVITSEAVVFPLEQATVAPKITSTVKKFYVQRGARVKKGQLLAVLENADLAAAAEASKGDFEQADAAYNTTIGSSLPQQIQKAQLDAQTAQSSFDAQLKIFDSRKELFLQGAIPRRELDAAEVALTQARSQNEQAQKQLADLQRLGKQQALKSAEGSRLSAEGKYRGAEAQLSYSEIRSPIDGVVTDRPLYEGDPATANQPILTVMNLSRLIAKSHIPQSEAATLKAGNPAELKVAGLDAPVKGRITLVSPALDAGSTTIEVWVEAAKPDPALKPGMTVEVSMTGKTVKDAIIVPVSAIFKNPEGGTDYVVLAGSDQKAHWKTVQIGVRHGDDVQIISGINAGDPVITSGGYALPDETKIKIEAAPPPGNEAGDKSGSAEKDSKAGSSAKPDDKDKE